MKQRMSVLLEFSAIVSPACSENAERGKDEKLTFTPLGVSVEYRTCFACAGIACDENSGVIEDKLGCCCLVLEGFLHDSCLMIFY